jgi:acyl-CoA dehydrogenase
MESSSKVPSHEVSGFALTERAARLRSTLLGFMEESVYPAEPVYEQQMAEAGDANFHPPVLEELKAEARRLGLWNLFYQGGNPDDALSHAEYAPLAEIMGRSPDLAPEACNCNAPDTGNMGILSEFGTPDQKQRWLEPLLEGEIRSAFAMTEPDVASSDATNVELRMRREGDEYVIDGRKWWTSNALHPNCRVLIVMGKTNPDGPKHKQQSMMVVPIDAPGVTVVRGLPVFGFWDREGHAEVHFEDVRVPASALLARDGDGFMISQARLGPGRIHHCMRSIGAAERALEMTCARAKARRTFGEPIAERSNIQDWIAQSRIEIEMVRLLTSKTAWLMDTVGNRHARVEIAAIKVAGPAMALRVIDRAIQVHGGAGVSNDVPLARMYAHQRALRIADGPDEVHLRTIARQELQRETQADGTASRETVLGEGLPA